MGVSRENPQQFPISQPGAAGSPWALGKGLAGPRQLLGFNLGSLSDGSDSGLGAQGGGCPAGLGSSGSITAQLRDPLHLNISNCQVLH